MRACKSVWRKSMINQKKWICPAPNPPRGFPQPGNPTGNLSIQIPKTISIPAETVFGRNFYFNRTQ